jgi:hypothetical protein
MLARLKQQPDHGRQPPARAWRFVVAATVRRARAAASHGKDSAAPRTVASRRLRSPEPWPPSGRSGGVPAYASTLERPCDLRTRSSRFAADPTRCTMAGQSKGAELTNDSRITSQIHARGGPAPHAAATGSQRGAGRQAPGTRRGLSAPQRVGNQPDRNRQPRQARFAMPPSRSGRSPSGSRCSARTWSDD